MGYRLRRPGSVRITFSSDCNGRFSRIVETEKCDNITFGSSVQFLVRVEVLRCADNQPEQIQRIQINPAPSGSLLRLNLYAYCYCPCELADPGSRPKTILPDCKKRGRVTCGVCYCREGYAGRNCEINTSNVMD